jgi:hypothetical protein
MSPRDVEIERVRWRDDSARVHLMDGAELHISVREYDRQYAPEVELRELHRLGEEVSAYDTALSWIAAHEAELVERWGEHCKGER